MTRRSHILLGMLAMALMAFAGAGCVEPLRPEEKQNGREGIQIPIRIFLPSPNRYATKAVSGGQVTALDDESALHSLQVWAFTHPTKPESAMSASERELFLNETSITDLYVPDLSVLGHQDVIESIELNMVIPRYILRREDEALKLDFYVLGNGASIGWDNTAMFTRGQLREVVINTDYFGTKYSQDADNFVDNYNLFPANGLPMACFFDNRGNGYDISFLKNNLTPTPEQMEEMGRVWPEMELSRSVARMRFLFAQATGMKTHIDSIRIFNFENANDPGLIPSDAHVFPREDASNAISLPDGVNYETLSWGIGTDPLVTYVGQMDDPTILCSNSELMRGASAQFFEDRVQEYIGTQPQQLTPLVVYLRESDRPIKGIIYYNGNRASGIPSQTVEFTMEGLGFPDQTNFYRNHSWTVYSYAIGQHMEVDVRLDDWVVPWSRSEAIINGENTVNVDQDGKFITDAPMQADSLRWDNGDVKYRPNSSKPEKKWFNVPVPAGDDGVMGRIVIYAPYNGQLIVTPVPVDPAEFWPRLGPEGNADAADWFDISLTPDRIGVDPGSSIPGLIRITIKRKNGTPPGRKAIRLSFSVKVSETQTIAADSELIDDEYHFIIDP